MLVSIADIAEPAWVPSALPLFTWCCSYKPFSDPGELGAINTISMSASCRDDIGPSPEAGGSVPSCPPPSTKFSHGLQDISWVLAAFFHSEQRL